MHCRPTFVLSSLFELLWEKALHIHLFLLKHDGAREVQENSL